LSFVTTIAKREVPQAVGMLKAFKDRVKEKKGRCRPRPEKGLSRKTLIRGHEFIDCV